MKKIVVGVVVGLAILTIMAAFVFAAAQKVKLVACPLNYPAGSTPPPGSGFVIFNNTRGVNLNLVVTVSLKGVEPNAVYDIYLFVDGASLNGTKVGTIKTNPRGNADFHLNTLLTKGQHILALDVTKTGSGSDVYETPGIHGGTGTVMIFK